MDGDPQRDRHSDGRGRRSARRPRRMDRSVWRYVNASLSAVGISGTYDLLRCPHVERRPVIPLVSGFSLRICPRKH